MLTCPYCQQRKIALTLHEPDGQYHMCRPCYMRWECTHENERREAGYQLRLLEWWWTLASIGGR